MLTAPDINGLTFKNGTVTLLARVAGNDGEAIVGDDVASISYSVFALDDEDPNARTAVEGHQDAALAVAAVVFDELQTDALWTVDTLGYNFRHTIDVATHAAFTLAGRRYLVEYRLLPTAGQVIVVRFRIHCV